MDILLYMAARKTT